MKKLLIYILMFLAFPIRYIIKHKKKTCFWGHDWGKWDVKVVHYLRTYAYTGKQFEYTKTVQYCNCKRCNKYKQKIIR